MKYLGIIILLFFGVHANANERFEWHPDNSTKVFLDLLQSTAPNLIRGPQNINEQLDLALTDALIAIMNKPCVGCNLTIDEIEQTRLMFAKDQPQVVAEKIGLKVFERFEVHLMNLTRSSMLFRDPIGRFLYNYLLNLFRFVMKDHSFESHKELIVKIFAGENSGLKCGIITAVKLGENDIPWLLHQAALSTNREIRFCLIGKLMPKLSPIAQMALSARVWNVSSPMDRMRLSEVYGALVEKLPELNEQSEPMVRWMLTETDPELRGIALSATAKPGIEQYPGLVGRLFTIMGEDNKQLIQNLGGRLCLPKLRPLLISLLKEASPLTYSRLSEEVLSTTLCVNDEKLAKYRRATGPCLDWLGPEATTD